MPLIHQFFVTDEQHEAILGAVSKIEAEGTGRDAAFAQVMYTGALTDGAIREGIAGRPAKTPAKKAAPKRR